jgi:hypothetical protein
MKIDVAWLKSHNACPERIARFVEWAGEQPRSLEEIADHYPDAKDLAWLIDLLCPFDIRMALACDMVNAATGEFNRYDWPPVGEKDYMRLARAGVKWKCLTEGLKMLGDSASAGRIRNCMFTYVNYFTRDGRVPEQIDTMFREALRSVPEA